MLKRTESTQSFERSHDECNINLPPDLLDQAIEHDAIDHGGGTRIGCRGNNN
jgi:hypothetical protein